jgi:putative transposase
MPNAPWPPGRPKFPRMPCYDYSRPGGYFVTLCVRDHLCLFGQIAEEQMTLNSFGRIIESEWLRSAEIRKELRLDSFIVMPNHIHGIVWLDPPDISVEIRTHCRARLPEEQIPHRAPRSLASFIAQFKAYSTKRINELRHTPKQRIWQPDYFEHVIRNIGSLEKIRLYIRNNPLKWDRDKENPLRAI